MSGTSFLRPRQRDTSSGVSSFEGGVVSRGPCPRQRRGPVPGSSRPSTVAVGHPRTPLPREENRSDTYGTVRCVRCGGGTAPTPLSSCVYAWYTPVFSTKPGRTTSVTRTVRPTRVEVIRSRVRYRGSETLRTWTSRTRRCRRRRKDVGGYEGQKNLEMTTVKPFCVCQMSFP